MKTLQTPTRELARKLFDDLGHAHPDWSHADRWAYMLNRMTRSDELFNFVQRMMLRAHGRHEYENLVVALDRCRQCRSEVTEICGECIGAVCSHCHRR